MITQLFRVEFGTMISVAVIVAVLAALSFSRREPMRCRQCREVNRSGARYCAQCGARLSGE